MLLNQLTVMLLNQLTYQLASIILWFLSKDFFLIVDSFQRFPGPKCTSLKKLDLVDCGWAMVLACSSLILATPRRCSILILALWVKYEQKTMSLNILQPPPGESSEQAQRPVFEKAEFDLPTSRHFHCDGSQASHWSVLARLSDSLVFCSHPTKTNKKNKLDH